VSRRNRKVDVTVITGLSGAGRSEAAKAFEDLGWFVVDNLPPALITTMLRLTLHSREPITQVALVIDARSGTFFDESLEALQKLRLDVSNFRMVFLEADDEVLVRRYEASRRKHPLAEKDRVIVGIQRERDRMEPFHMAADLIIDTSQLSVRELRQRLSAYFEADSGDEILKTTIISFGYKFGIPLDADIVLDVRFLPNPHWIPELREFTGLDENVRDYVLGQEATSEFIKKSNDLFETLLEGYSAEGRHYLTVAVGCTGGRHRSVVLGEVLGAHIASLGYGAKVIHRDAEREPGP
jgi:UPF0042 nucleotide-binding protein